MWRRIKSTKIHDQKNLEKMLVMVPPDPICTIGTNIDTKDLIVTSLTECSRQYGGNKRTIFLISTVLEVEIGPKATTPGRCRTFFVAKFDLGGG